MIQTNIFIVILLLISINCCRLSTAFNKNYCQDLNKKSLLYDYNSEIVGFANATKYIVFSAKFEVTCLKYDLKIGRFEILINFINLSTKMKNNSTDFRRPLHNRQRKIPIKSITSIGSTTTNRIVGSRPPDQNEAKWFPLSLQPVLFYQYQNGTITDIFIHKADHDRQSEDESIKKAIVFMFHTYRSNKLNADTLENDDLGQHFSRYSFQNVTDFLSVTKIVRPDDFVKLQFDSINFNQINVYLKQKQVIDNENGRIELTDGQISTQPIAKAEQLPIGVVVNYSLKFAGENCSTKSRPNYGEFVRFTRDNFTNQHFDNNDNLLKIFQKKLEILKDTPINKAFDHIWFNPDKPGSFALKVKSLLNLESRLFVAKKLRQQDLLAQILPVFTKNVATARTMKKWKVVVRLLELTAGCFSPDVEKIYLDILNTGELVQSFKYAQNFLNALAQLQYPSDAILQRLITVLTRPDSWPISNALRLNFHALNDISILVTRDAIITDKIRQSVIDLFVSKLQPFVKDCNQPEESRHALLDAVGNIVVPTMLKRSEKAMRRLVMLLLKMTASCHLWQPSLAVDSLTALRHILDDDQVQTGLLNILHKAHCETKADLVQQLASLTSSGLRQSDAGTVNARRTWPKYNFTAIDGYLWRSMNQSDDDNVTESSGDFWCNQNVLRDYFAKKSESAMKQRQLDDQGHKIVRRQTSSSGGGGGGGSGGMGGLGALSSLGSGGGGGLSPKFVPELNCQRWDSQVGLGFVPEVYDNPGKFDRDSLRFGHKKRHCLFNATFNFGALGGAGFKAGFFSGQSNASDGRLFGRTWLGMSLVLNVEIASVSFSREQLDGKFSGETKLDVVGTNYITDIQYKCNQTVDKWHYSTASTLPAFRVVFSGFAFIMNADFEVGVNLTFWPSHCGGDGSMGVRFQPYVYFNADAYAELENDYFGIGTLASLSINYYVDLMTVMPSGCFYLYHGNDMMFFKFDFYLKLPTFVFVNFDPVPVVLKQSYAILTWQFVIKKSSRYVLYGFCFPNLNAQPDTPKWLLGNEGDDEYQ